MMPNKNMKAGSMLATFAAICLAVPSNLRAELIVHYNCEETEGPLVDQAGGETAEPINTGHLYQQPSVPAGTYGAITLTSSLGNAVGISADQTGAWTLDEGESAELGNLVNNFTVMSWVFVPPGGIGDDWPRTIGDSNPDRNEGWNFGIRNKTTLTNTVSLVGNAIKAIYSAKDVVTDGIWQHIAATKSSTAGVTIYLNGSVVGTDVTAEGLADFNLSNNAYFLGDSNTSTPDSNINDMLMDEVRVYDTVLGAADIISAAAGGQISISIQAVHYANGELTFEWNSTIGKQYKIYRSLNDELRTPLVDWDELDDSYPEGGAISEITSYTDSSLEPGTQEAFYRIEE